MRKQGDRKQACRTLLSGVLIGLLVFTAAGCSSWRGLMGNQPTSKFQNTMNQIDNQARMNAVFWRMNKLR